MFYSKASFHLANRRLDVLKQFKFFLHGLVFICIKQYGYALSMLCDDERALRNMNLFKEGRKQFPS